MISIVVIIISVLTTTLGMLIRSCVNLDSYIEMNNMQITEASDDCLTIFLTIKIWKLKL